LSNIEKKKILKQVAGNHAFIDGTNLHLTMINVGWALDYRRFRVYLKEKYHVTEAYYFIGRIPENEDLYTNLESSGYRMVFKPTQYRKGEGYKGNCDAELVLKTIVTLDKYDKAIIVTSDGDFSCLVEHLWQLDKLERVLAPCKEGCSYFLRKAARSKIDYIDNLRGKLEYKNVQKREETPHKDETL
jgi:uncharacterized LabA/DUF88 family protein